MADGKARAILALHVFFFFSVCVLNGTRNGGSRHLHDVHGHRQRPRQLAPGSSVTPAGTVVSVTEDDRGNNEETRENARKEDGSRDGRVVARTNRGVGRGEEGGVRVREPRAPWLARRAEQGPPQPASRLA